MFNMYGNICSYTQDLYGQRKVEIKLEIITISGIKMS